MADNQQANDNGATQQVSANPLLRVGQPSVQLKLQFGTLSGTKTFSYNYANRAADEEDVHALINAMIANGSIFQDPPLVAKAVWTEIKTINEYSLPE